MINDFPLAIDFTLFRIGLRTMIYHTYRYVDINYVHIEKVSLSLYDDRRTNLVIVFVFFFSSRREINRILDWIFFGGISMFDQDVMNICTIRIEEWIWKRLYALEIKNLIYRKDFKIFVLSVSIVLLINEERNFIMMFKAFFISNLQASNSLK